jgi:hypothetical protein
MTRSTTLYSLALGALLLGCGSGDDAAGSSSATSGGSGGSAAEDLEMTEADFECILDWTAVHKFRITNKLGHQEEAIAVANSADGGVYPVGTIIQLIPTEAMVKRRPGFSAATKDWEFFFLEVTGKQTTIKARGAGEVVNGFGGNCLNCHALAEPQWDLVCEDSHGCDPLPFTAEQIKMVQDSDPRCVP